LNPTLFNLEKNMELLKPLENVANTVGGLFGKKEPPTQQITQTVEPADVDKFKSIYDSDLNPTPLKAMKEDYQNLEQGHEKAHENRVETQKAMEEIVSAKQQQEAAIRAKAQIV
jgi:hypothetical protein